MSALTEGQKVFDRYTLMKVVGSGRMSIVWLAWDESEEHDCALKFLPDIVKPDPSALATLKREAQRLQDLKHEQIVPTLTVESEGPLVAIVSPAIEGATLSQMRDQKSGQTFSPAELSDWMGQMCEVLEFAHAEGYAHGDLKPGNMIVDQKGNLRLLDFGLEKHIVDFVSRATAFEEASLELTHISPQLAAGEAISTLDDIYAVGASLYELLTSKPPFFTGNLLLQLEQKIPPPMTHRRKELRVIGEPISRIWEETVAACLSKDPAQRPQDVSQLVEMMELQRPAMPQVEPISTEAAPAAEPDGMKKLYVVAGGLVFAVLCLGVFLIAFKKSPEDKAIATLDKAKQAEAEAERLKQEMTEESKRKEEELKRAEAEAERIKREAAESARKREEEIAKREAESNAAQEEKTRELQAELARLAEEKAKLERMRSQPVQGGTTTVDNSATEDALRKIEEAQKRFEAAQEKLAVAQKAESERLEREAVEKEKARLAEIEAAKMKAVQDEEQRKLAEKRAAERAKQMEADRIARLEQEKKRRADEARLKAEALRKREAELAEKRFAPQKTVWLNSLGMRVVKAGNSHVAAIECRVADFRAFVKATQHNAGRGWERPGFNQDNSHPVVNVSWADAEAFCKWLTAKETGEQLLEGFEYRLPTDQEWSQFVGLSGEAGSTPLARDSKVKGVYPWGKVWPPSIGSGNYAENITYDDWSNTAPVGSFRPNQYGIYDLGGNVWEWCADWGDSSQKNRVLRGGSWYGYNAGALLASYRRYLSPAERKDDQGFRVVLARK